MHVQLTTLIKSYVAMHLEVITLCKEIFQRLKDNINLNLRKHRTSYVYFKPILQRDISKVKQLF